MNAQQTPGPWSVGVHPFGGGYCLSRVGTDGKREHKLSNIGAAPQIASWPTRAAAEAAVAEGIAQALRELPSFAAWRAQEKWLMARLDASDVLSAYAASKGRA